MCGLFIGVVMFFIPFIESERGEEVIRILRA